MHLSPLQIETSTFVYTNQVILSTDHSLSDLERWKNGGFIGRGEKLAERLCRMVGYPVEEYFLYSTQFDPAWLVRLVAVGLVEMLMSFRQSSRDTV